MGMLGNAFLAGASQGLNVLGQGMLKDVERQQDQTIWEKRTALLSQIQRENAKVAREDQAAFDDQRFPTKLDQAKQLINAQGVAQREVRLADAQDTDLLNAEIKRAQALSDAQLEQDINRTYSLATNPKMQEADRIATDRKMAALQRELNMRLQSQVSLHNATRPPKPQTLSDKLLEIEGAIGRPLTAPEKEAFAGVGKSDNKTQELRTKLAEEAASKLIEAGTLKPEGRADFVNTQLQSYKEAESRAISGELLRTARHNGTVSTFIERMKAQGADEATILKLGVTKDELKKATAAAPAARKPKPEATFETMPMESLRGYTSQEARAVYARRLAEQQRLAANPRFWLERSKPAQGGGLDAGY